MGVERQLMSARMAGEDRPWVREHKTFSLANHKPGYFQHLEILQKIENTFLRIDFFFFHPILTHFHTMTPFEAPGKQAF